MENDDMENLRSDLEFNYSLIYHLLFTNKCRSRFISGANLRTAGLLSLLATVDMAFGQLSDVGLRRLITGAEERSKLRSSAFLKQVLENRPRFSFAISATIQILLVAHRGPGHFDFADTFSGASAYVLVGLLTGLVLAGIFRQLVPLFISTRDPEGTLLFLLPVIRPLLPADGFCRRPFPPIV